MPYTRDEVVLLYEDSIVSFLDTKMTADGYSLRVTADVSISVNASTLGQRDTLIVNWMKDGGQNTSRTGGSTGFTTRVHNFAIRIVTGVGLDDQNAREIKKLLGAVSKHLESRAFHQSSGITPGAIRMYRVPGKLWYEDKKEKSIEGLINFELTVDESVIDYGG